jgi:hypothetical protein
MREEESVAVFMDWSESISAEECLVVESVGSEGGCGVSTPEEEEEVRGGGGPNGAAGGTSLLNNIK